MEVFKKNGKIYLTALKFTELLTLLKIQIKCDLIFFDDAKVINELLTITLIDRTLVGGTQKIKFSINGETYIDNYDVLLNKISVITKNHNLSVTIDQNDFRLQEALIRMLPEINQQIVNDCVYLALNADIYTIKYKTFKNGDNNILYYFQLNNTLLAFTEDGPKLITDNTNMNNITDILCN